MNILISHVIPVNPVTQSHVTVLIPSIHWPPFLHASGMQSSISDEREEQSHQQEQYMKGKLLYSYVHIHLHDVLC